MSKEFDVDTLSKQTIDLVETIREGINDYLNSVILAVRTTQKEFHEKVENNDE